MQKARLACARICSFLSFLLFSDDDDFRKVDRWGAILHSVSKVLTEPWWVEMSFIKARNPASEVTNVVREADSLSRSELTE